MHHVCLLSKIHMTNGLLMLLVCHCLCPLPAWSRSTISSMTLQVACRLQVACGCCCKIDLGCLQEIFFQCSVSSELYCVHILKKMEVEINFHLLMAALIVCAALIACCNLNSRINIDWLARRAGWLYWHWRHIGHVRRPGRPARRRLSTSNVQRFARRVGRLHRGRRWRLQGHGTRPAHWRLSSRT